MKLGKRNSAAWRNKSIGIPKRRKFNLAPPQFGYGYDPKRSSRRPMPPNAEIKWYDQTGTSAFTSAGSALPTRCSIASLNLIASGNEGATRIGNKITVTKLNFRYFVGTSDGSSATFNDLISGDHYFRTMIFIDTQSNGGVPNFSDVFEEYPDGTGSDQFSIFNSLRETGRFKVLMDKVSHIPAYSPVYNTVTDHYHVPNRLCYEQASFKLNLPVVYSDAYPNGASIRNNNIFVMVFSSHASAAGFKFTYRSRLRYSDY